MAVSEGGEAERNADIGDQIAEVAGAVSFEWIRAAIGRVDELARFLRRNIQKSIALDAMVMELRAAA